MSTLEHLKSELMQLTKWRADIVARAQAEIDAANHHFDAEATELNRAIRRLQPKPDPEPAPTPTAKPTRKRQPRFSLEGMEDWAPEEIAHYKKLKGVSA